MGALGFCCKGCANTRKMRIGMEVVYLLVCFCRFHRRTRCLYIKLGGTFSGALSICLLGIYVPVDMKHCHIKPIVP